MKSASVSCQFLHQILVTDVAAVFYLTVRTSDTCEICYSSLSVLTSDTCDSGCCSILLDSAYLWHMWNLPQFLVSCYIRYLWQFLLRCLCFLTVRNSNTCEICCSFLSVLASDTCDRCCCSVLLESAYLWHMWNLPQLLVSSYIRYLLQFYLRCLCSLTVRNSDTCEICCSFLSVLIPDTCDSGWCSVLLDSAYLWYECNLQQLLVSCYIRYLLQFYLRCLCSLTVGNSDTCEICCSFLSVLTPDTCDSGWCSVLLDNAYHW